jgi:uncharacterized membrane-anchored protein
MDRIVREGVARGLLAPQAPEQAGHQRPWPVLLLTAVAAWFSALPLALFVGVILGDSMKGSQAPVIVGAAILAGAVLVLRQRTLPLFVEQLALPCLVVGAAFIGFGLATLLNTGSAMALLVPILCLVAFLVPHNWLRALLGVGMAVAAALALQAIDGNALLGVDTRWLGWHGVSAVWLASVTLQRTPIDGVAARRAAALESTFAGVAVAALVGLSVLSGQTFLLGSGPWRGAATNGMMLPVTQAISMLASLAAAAWLAHRWPALRTWWFGAIAVAVAGIAWLVPSLGAALAMLALCATSGQAGLAVLAGLAAIWMIGGLYYQLAWTLASKALVLVGAGAIFGILARLAAPDVAAPPAAAPVLPGKVGRSGAALLLAGALVLVVANAAIWDKERLIANGAPVFVQLAPVDPRSLMQGDYMQLAFAMPSVDATAPLPRGAASRIRMLARKDTRGVATLLGEYKGEPLGAGEFLIEAIYKNHRWALVTDAWFFAEGEAERWSAAKYGEFRVTPDGRALLVGLRGARLEEL